MKKIIFSVLGVLTIGFCQGQSVFINELHYDNSGGDVDELIEVAGPAGTDLTNWSIALYNGGNGEVYRTVSLSGIIDDQQSGYGTLAFLEAGIQNGSPDGLALVDANNNLVQFLSYEGSFTATNGPANGIVSTDIGVEETTSTPVGHSLQLMGSGTTYSQFSWDLPEPASAGAVNPGQVFAPVGNPPQIDCPPNIAVETDEGLCQALVEFDPATAVDPEDGVLAVTQLSGPASGSLFPLGDTVILFSATDSDNNTVFCELTITVIDMQVPELSCPVDQYEQANPDLFYEVPDYWALGMATSLDNCSAQTINQLQAPAPGEQLPIGMHEIEISAADEFGNTSTCSFKLYVQTPLSIEDFSQTGGIAVFPNPSTGLINIHNPEGKTYIYNLAGALVKTVELSPSNIGQTLDLSNFSAGVYYLRFELNNGSLVKRLIKI